MSWFFTNFIASFLLPPLSILILLATGVFMLYRGHQSAKTLVFSSLGLLWIASTPYFAESTLQLLESGTTVLTYPHPDAKAIVILGGGTYFHAPEYSELDTVSRQTLPRLRYGAKLHRETGIPILVSGGAPLGNAFSEAQQMKTALQQDFHVPVRWMEDNSDNTLENAVNAYQVLHKEGISKILLVTQAWHMPRAAMSFRHSGFEVIDAPVEFTTRYQTDLMSFLPRAEALLDSKLFVHEVIGLIWYRVKLTLSDNTTTKGTI